MAEGFLQPDHINDMESVGNKFINVLLHNSLLLVASKDSSKVMMHDLVHDLACSVLGSCKVDDIINSDGISQVRYYRRQKSSLVPKEMAKHLRALLFEGDISDTMFSDFKSLHALTLFSNEAKELSNSIKKLIHLRNLDISNCPSIAYLPEWVGELLHLQTLRADTSYLKKLPSTVKNLINLRHLHFRIGVVQPVETGRLTSLQTLPYFTVGNEKGYKIDELGSLNNLKGTLLIRNLDKVRDKEDALKANIFLKPNLFSLQLFWGWNRSEGDERNDESVLEGLQPHSNLKRILICGFDGNRLPSWFMKMEVRDEPQGFWIGLNKLTKISVQECTKCEEFPALGHLPNLKSLTLSRLKNVMSITSPSYDCISVFPALETLELYDMPKLREWTELETRPNCQVKLFPNLQHLRMSFCSPIPLSNIFETMSSSHLTLLSSLTTFSIKGFDELECLPDWLFYNNHNLSELKICKCPKLIDLPDGLQTLNSLKELIIDKCPNLKWIGNLKSLASSLQKLSLVGLKTLPRVLDNLPKPKATTNSCSEILSFCSLQELEIDVSMECNVAFRESVDALFQGCCHSLAYLKLTGSETWECLPESIQNLSVLSTLKLKNFGVEELPEWFGNLSSLVHLILSCKNLRRLPSVDAMQRLTNLKYINIYDCSDELHIDSELLSLSHFSIDVHGCPVRQPSDMREALEYLRSIQAASEN